LRLGPARPASARPTTTTRVTTMTRLASWLGWVPVALFLAFVAAFLLAPTATLLVQAFSGEHGPTFEYVALLGTYRYRTAFTNSIILSAASALVGLVAGAALAHAVLRPGAPRGLRAAVTSFAAVAANFAGVPLAFAFISTLGTLGLLTVALKRIGIDLYGAGFSLYSLAGLTITYAYFQIPLMLIIIIPAFEGLRREWQEAAANLGASSWQYWRHVGLPVLLPSLLAAFVLLFGNAFSAYATPYALTSGNIGLVPIEISNLLSGNVTLAPQAGAALALGMVVVMSVVLILYLLASRRAARWRA
jgi:putative spermidine/putrescine transport system permease protein